MIINLLESINENEQIIANYEKENIDIQQNLLESEQKISKLYEEIMEEKNTFATKLKEQIDQNKNY